MRTRSGRLLSGVLATLALFLAAVPASQAADSAYKRVLRAYETTGTIGACWFSSRELSAALKQIDPYGAQYFEDFTTAVQAALAERASGACSKTHAAVPATANGSAPLPRIPLTSATGAGVPAPIVLMAVIGGLIMLLVAVVALARAGAWQPTRAAAWPDPRRPIP